MSEFLIVISVILFIGSLLFLFLRQLLAPASAYLGMLAISFARTADGLPIVPVNNTILMGWLCMTILVMTATILQPLPLRQSSRGEGYMAIGALAGMAVGLLGYSFASLPSMLYGIMIVATVAGTFLGFLLYSRTPEGIPTGIGSGHFFKYLLAKGFPTAITVMQIGVVLVLIIATRHFATN